MRLTIYEAEDVRNEVVSESETVIVQERKPTLKDMPTDDRPREKLMEKGARALSDAELLAILIGSGTPQETAVQLMQRVLGDCGHDLKRLGRLSVKELCRFAGIGPAKAVTLIAACELGRRRAALRHDKVPKLTSARLIYDYMSHHLADLPHEEVWLLMLNSALHPVGEQCLSKGGLTTSVIDVRHALKTALLHEATAIVLLHNHPTGEVSPSANDDAMTAKVKQAAQLLDIRLLDHLITGMGSYYSYADNNRI